jgi:hypothetical protein
LKDCLTKDDVGLSGGVELIEGEEVKAGENVREELVGKNFDELGRLKNLGRCQGN